MKISLSLIVLLAITFSAWSQTLLSDMIPHPFYKRQVNAGNEVMLVTDGRQALELRLEMIRSAKKSIEVEYFIFDVDLAGKILTRELIEAAKRGVKVRMLIDKSKPIFEFDEYYARILNSYNIKVRYYNNAPLIRISTVQFRNHRKLLVIDDREALTGGRNIGDDYFDLSPKFNFNDTDVFIKGPIVKTMRESFDEYFEHSISERIKFTSKPDLIKLKKAQDFLKETPEERQLKHELEVHTKPVLASQKLYNCPELTFVTDAPGADFFSRLHPKFDEKYKFVRKTLFDKLMRVDKSILISSPYLIANKHSNELMNAMLKKNVDITVYTNSLASTDAVYVAANLYYEIFKWTRKGINIYLHDGLYTNENPELDGAIQNAGWGTHTKAQVYGSTDGSEAMIGTYNIDNRSNFYNSEMAVFCKGNEEFSSLVKDEIMTMARKGIKVNKDKTATDRHGNIKSVYGSSQDNLRLMNLIFLPSWLLKFLL